MNNKIIIKESKTVKEFIEILKQLPQELPIKINYNDDFEIIILDDFYDDNTEESYKAVLLL